MEIVLKHFDSFEPIEEQAGFVVKAAHSLNSAVSANDAPLAASAEVVQALCARGDDALCAAMDHLDRKNATTIPYGKDDVLRVMLHLNGVLESLELLARHTADTHAGELQLDAARIFAIFEQCATQLSEAVDAFGESKRAIAPVVAIRQLTHRACVLADQAIEQLRHSDEDAMRRISTKDTYILIRRTADSFREAAYTIEDLTLKHR